MLSDPGIQESATAGVDTDLPPTYDALERVWRVLNRLDPIDSLEELRNGLEPLRRPPLATGALLALGFDTNALFRLGLGAQGADSLDYLRTLHKGPILVPGQSVQEVWNNLLAAVEPQAKKLRRRFEELEVEMRAIGQNLGESGSAVREAIEELRRVHGDWIDPASQSAFGSTLDVLLAVGKTAYVPRDRFAEIARIRRDTKTPPGFQDVIGYGDFFIWADFLYGLALSDTSSLQGIVFVTNDTKSDWSRNGVPHPILVAEALAIAPVPFRLWTLQEFQAFAHQFSS